jgi:hypothetical protein
MAPVSESSSTQDSCEEAVLGEIEHLPISNADSTRTPTHAAVTPSPASSVANHIQKRAFYNSHDDLVFLGLLMYTVVRRKYDWTLLLIRTIQRAANEVRGGSGMQYHVMHSSRFDSTFILL